MAEEKELTLDQACEQAFGHQLVSSVLFGKTVSIVAEEFQAKSIIRSVCFTVPTQRLVVRIEPVMTFLTFHMEKASPGEIAKLEQQDGGMYNETMHTSHLYSISWIEYHVIDDFWEAMPVCEPFGDVLQIHDAILAMELKDAGEESPLAEMIPKSARIAPPWIPELRVEVKLV